MSGKQSGAKQAGEKKVSGVNQARRYARERTLQALYQWELAGGDVSTIKKEIIERQEMSLVDVDYFVSLFDTIAKDPDAIDAQISPALDRPLEDLDPIERCILRISVCEFVHHLEIPARVVINEAIEVTKRFGADKGHRYVNGVLDKLAVLLRPIEMGNK